MHDDDSNGPEENTGRLYHSGFNPSGGRAEYALPLGEAALQGGEPEFPSVAISRRRFVAAGVGTLGLGIAYGAGALFASGPKKGVAPPAPTGERPQPVRSPAIERFLASARDVAYGPIGDLWHAREPYISLVESDGGHDPKLWHGMERLASYAILDGTSVGFGVANRLITAMGLNPPPANLGHLQLKLEEFASTWKKVNR